MPVKQLVQHHFFQIIFNVGLTEHIRTATKFSGRKIPLTVFASPMPEVYRKRDKQQVPRGVANRRAALSWIRNNAESGVLYFGDDDNTFDLDLFQEIRHTKKVSMFPVGLIGEFAVSAPVVKEGKVVGFFDSWPANRRFPVDMAGFAVSIEFLKLSPGAIMPFKVGFEEDVFLKSLGIRYEDIEPLADNCTKILVWHTQTVNKPIPTLRIVNEDTGTSINELINNISEMGVIKSSQRKGTSLYYTNSNGRITF
ncbi:galactosylgalactosylxylosylprotein 3-beta-glucuronosyltransferase S isoform X2 [Cephus cinctus]|uniref:Galactosylgalactosylxylosylprotein 3-beta-glucuronosyltransferase n=1 Tax=Cephus cinctus TaxID=211228 RepID=A0AAJ7RLE3_CEPCN|nr:galactosylgalactosylxylosylprotein 3-beta-glucuronosyltransferase S isoform X2 [Cephus cinctus]XP_024942603.1 galactosylgalactosylxylosylprotein 3-beta-glucuronosyltransferase S isoform X2 [Cephus cinctus]